MTDRKQERFDEARERFVRAANDAGIDPGLMVKIAGFESGGFNPNARPISRNPDLNTVRQFDGTMAMSSAHGYGQFLNGTWQEMINRYGEKYGIEGAATMTRAEANSPELRTNRDLQASMLAEFTRENIERIRGIAGPNADANVYAMHNLGAEAGPRFLRALQDNPNALVTDNGLMTNDIVRRNPSLYKDGDRTLTVQEAYDRMGQQLAPYQRFADQVAGQTQGTPTEPVPGQTPPGQTPPGATAPTNEQTGAPPTTAPQTTAPQDTTLPTGSPQNAAPQTTAPQAPSETTAENVLRRDDTGPEVGHHQRMLADLGYRGVDGKPLQVNGTLDADTEHAIKQFQRDRGLEPLGEIGPKTRTAIDDAGRELVTHPDNPNNALYKKMLEKVYEAEDGRKIPHGEHSRNLAAALTVEAVRGRVTDVDRVDFNRDGSMARAVQFSRMGDQYELNRSTEGLATQQAARQPILESSEQVANNVHAQQREERQPSVARER